MISPSHNSKRPACFGWASDQRRNSSTVILCFGSAVMGKLWEERTNFATGRDASQARETRYCALDNRVGTMRCTLIASRSMSSVTFGAMVFFQKSLW